MEKLDDITGESIFPPITFFVSKKNLDRVQEQYVDQEAEENLSENNNDVLNTDKEIFFTSLSGLALITMDKKCSDKLYAYNKNRVAQISDFEFLHDLDYIKKNTWQNIMADISDLIPAGVGNDPFYGYFLCDTFHTDVSEKHEEIFDLLCAGTDLEADLPDPYPVYIADHSDSTGAWHSAEPGGRALRHLERTGSAAWRRADCRLSDHYGSASGIFGADVSFLGKGKIGKGDFTGVV